MNNLINKELPKHVAIIMDGNGRWAKERSLPRFYGHSRGAQRASDMIEACHSLGIPNITLFAFSEENWSRPIREVDFIFSLVEKYIKMKVSQLVNEGIRFQMMGMRENIPKRLLDTIEFAEKETLHGKNMNFILAMNYSGRMDLTCAMKKIGEKIFCQKLDPKNITPQLIQENLMLPKLPEPDLLIRTSGEERISNFMLWQLAYTEFYFTTTHWPDFSKKHFMEALQSFHQRERRFGKIEDHAIENGLPPPLMVDSTLC